MQYYKIWVLLGLGCFQTIIFSQKNQSIGIVCIAKNYQELNKHCNNLQFSQEIKKNLIILCESTLNHTDIDGIKLQSLCDFQSIIKNFNYILIINPILLPKYSSIINIRLPFFNACYIGNNVSGLELSDVSGNFYIHYINKFVNTTKLSNLNNFIYETIYSKKLLIDHFNGKGTTNIYIVEVFLQSCLFYNKIGIYAKY